MDRKSFLKSLITAPLVMSNLETLDKVSRSFSNTPRMPVLFLGHGSPMNAIEENEFVRGFRTVSQRIAKPNAILCISAHWLTRGTKVTAMAMPRTIHDFGGFPDALFQVQYPAKGDPELAKLTQTLLSPTDIGLDETWGLDHGAWSVLKHLYPDADIPVIQMSIDYSQPARYHYELAKRLQPLREKGILIVGSGNMIHNLNLVDFANLHKDNYGYDWAIEARTLMNDWLKAGNYDPFLNIEQQGKAVNLAIPTPDHFFPLLYSLGLQTKDEPLTLFNDKLLGGSLSMTSVQIGA
ncbi:MAG: hypothetical protein RL757_2024 [Bacteroidota bacterium]